MHECALALILSHALVSCMITGIDIPLLISIKILSCYDYYFLVPEMNGLVIEATSLSSFVPHADANFPFKTPLCIHAVDADGHIITDGPDSTLVQQLMPSNY